MTREVAEELIVRMEADFERLRLTHFVVHVRALTAAEGRKNYQVVVGTICRDFLSIDELGDWDRDKWMLGVRDK